MRTFLFNGADKSALSDGVSTWLLPPGFSEFESPTNVLQLTVSTNPSPLSITITDGIQGLIGTSSTGTPTWTMLGEMPPDAWAFGMGMTTILGMGLPIVVLRYFRKLTGTGGVGPD